MNARTTAKIAAVSLVFAVSAITGCSNTEQGQIPITLGDPDDYAALVQPYVGLRCGSLDCHGDSGRPLRLYAEYGLRMRAELRDEPVAAAEIADNVAAFAGISAGSEPAGSPGSLALHKGLAVAAGGFAHAGGDIWDSVDEPGYVCLRGWLDGQSGDPAVADACASAYLEVMPAEPAVRTAR